MNNSVVIRNVEVEGRSGLDVRVADGVVSEIGENLRGAADIDGRGGALIPGLVDHHIHLLGLAADAASLKLDDVRDADALADRLRVALTSLAPGAWLRATGYHEGVAGTLDRHHLDRIAPRHRLRVQHRTGALWILNSLALDAVLEGSDAPDGVERAADGAPTGRIWRGDSWLRGRVKAAPPPLGPIGRMLAACGVTAVTDASVTTDDTAVGLITGAMRAGDLPQRVRLMSAGPLSVPEDVPATVGPVKVLLDDHRLPDLDDFIRRIAAARTQSRSVAVHCVTAGELALTMAAFGVAGSRLGDRVEHGGVIPMEAIDGLRQLSLTVVTQSAFVFDRGDRYSAEVPPDEQDDLYRCASLLRAGVPVAGSSDAPYASADPWVGVRAAVQRRTREGRLLGAGERIDARRALDLYLRDPAAPHGPPRRVVAGMAADLCLLNSPLAEALQAPSSDNVRGTWLAGRQTYGGA